MKFKVLSNRVLIEEIEDNLTTSGLTLLKEERGVLRGKVIDLEDDPNIEIGDQVIFEPHVAIDFVFCDKRYLIVLKDDILGVIKEK